MTHTPLARLRRLWLDVHLWIGVGLLVVLIPLGLSGSALVWREVLDHSLYAQRYAVSGAQAPLAPSAYAAAAQQAFGKEAQITQLRLPFEAGDPVVATGRIAGRPGAGGRPRVLNAWIDPPTAKVLDRAEVAKGFTMTLHRLHGTLLIPGTGRKVVGWLGWAMFVNCATGLWLWWPRHGSFLQALRWRRGASQLFNLHHTVGFWVCLPLAALSLTGVYIAFPQTARALFGIQGQAQPPRPGAGDPRFAPPLAQPHLTLDAAIATAQAKAAPGVPLSAVTWPQTDKAPTWKVEFARPGSEKPQTVRVVDAGGEARGGDRGGMAAMGGGGTQDPLSRWMRRIHDGTDMGLAWRVIITLAGVAPTVLALSGLVMWLRRSSRLRRLRA